MMKQNGFTMIELLTALGIVTILAAVAVPNLQSFSMNSRQTGGVNELVSGMRIARNTAISTNTRVTMCASKSGTSCDAVGWDQGWIAFVDPDGDQTLDADETILRAGSASENLTIKSGQFANFLVYRPNGRVMNANVAQNSGLFAVCDDRGAEHAKGIVLDLSGRARAVDRDSGAAVLYSCG